MPFTAKSIINVMAFVWAWIALFAAHAPIWSLLAPGLISAVLIAAPIPHTVERKPSERRRVGRLVAMASAGEGLGIFLGINLATWAGRPDLWICVLAGVVGLHFVPLARWMPAPRYYYTGAALVIASGLGIVLDSNLRTVSVATCAAVILWATIISAGVYYRRLFSPRDTTQSPLP